MNLKFLCLLVVFIHFQKLTSNMDTNFFLNKINVKTDKHNTCIMIFYGYQQNIKSINHLFKKLVFINL